MIKPIYELSNQLLSSLTSIERLYGQIEALKIPQKLEVNLERHNLIQSSYASNRIEGNPLTLPEVTNLLLDDRVPVNRDEKEVVNYFQILTSMDTYKERQLDLDLVCEFHKLLMTGVDETAGEIRNVKVVVGKYKEEKGNVSLRVKHDPPFHTRPEIEGAVNELLVWLGGQKDTPVVVTTGLFHHHFVYIHPFEDGNGRVCRLLTALIFNHSGYQINKYFVLDDYYDIDRQQYSDMLHEADSGNLTTWLEYYSDGVKFSLQSALHRVKEALLTLRISEQPSPREREVLEMIQRERELKAQDVVASLKISRQQAHALLRGLVDKGLLEKKGSTKASYYTLK